ncbi:hypothetical protein LDG_6372 [Legionella drancourtii LLAP12]|uniref:Uncharacterized protein n=1 Tax=Legionella drancourtii LLAP12 TaxID=658187 RepID=G9EMA8_9GAMM|nr:hypothetical protein LDG_6372 [Legionella drancourtii LLAP12]
MSSSLAACNEWHLFKCILFGSRLNDAYLRKFSIKIKWLNT